MERKELEEAKGRQVWDTEPLIFPLFWVPPFPINHLFPAVYLCPLEPNEAIYSKDLSTGFTSSESVYTSKEECVNLNKHSPILSVVEVEEQALPLAPGVIPGSILGPPLLLALHH